MLTAKQIEFAQNASILYIHEIFVSIQGEGEDIGKPTVFCRLYGCNIGCSYCDQKQVKEDLKRMSLDKIVSKIRSFNVKNICITGGEPLIQWNNLYPLVLELLTDNYTVSIETSGCYPIEEDLYNRSFKYVMDVKCPSSGVVEKNILDNILNLRSNDEIKFVIADYKDYEYMKDVLKKYPTNSKILVSPCFTPDNKMMINAEELIENIIKDRLQNIRLSLQVHKFINVK